jgi:DamX protein
VPDNLPQRQDAWLRQQDPAHYTLQLVAGEHPDTIRKFITEHKLANDLALYHSTRNDKPWFGLTYGIYPDKQAAIDARARLPRELRRLKPWVRDLGGIQATLN